MVSVKLQTTLSVLLDIYLLLMTYFYHLHVFISNFKTADVFF